MLGFLTWDLDPVLIALGPLQIRFYGVFFALTIWTGYKVWENQCLKNGESRAFADRFLWWGVVAIVGGSKVSTKLEVLTSLVEVVDQLIVGGGIANTFMLAQGLPIGKSLAEPDLVPEARAVMAAMKARGAEVPIPSDVVVAQSFAADAPATLKRASDVGPDDLILDIGPETAALYAAEAARAGTIFWNGL